MAMKRKRTVKVTSVEQRVALAFQELQRKYPGKAIDGYDVCKYTGLAHEEVNKAIAGLMDKGVIQRTGKTTRQ